MKDNLLSFNALGTLWTIITPQRALSNQEKVAIDNRVRQFEKDYSRFNPDSLLSKLNDNKQLDNPPKELCEMLQKALFLYETSGKLFNISVGAILEQQGYGRSPDYSASISDNLHNDIVVTESSIKIAPHIRIDLGGLGKGWLVDRLHELLNSFELTDHIVNGGGDIRVGIKSQEIFVQHPQKSDVAVARLLLRDQAFAASSNLKRRWKTSSGDMAHIVHPAGNHTSTILQICTIANTCLEADTAATILFLMDLSDRKDFASQHAVQYIEVTDTMIVQNGLQVPIELY